MNWKELVQEVHNKGFTKSSPMSRLVWSCETARGIDQHAADDIQAVIDSINEAARLLKIAREHISDRDLLHQIKWYLGETDIPYHPMPEDMK